MPKPQLIESRDRYHIFATVTTRWKDNDVYGHINNAVYNSWMDTAVTDVFREHYPGIPDTPVIPVAAETLFTFHQSVSHPGDVETGFRVDRIGRSSVCCGVGIFANGQSEASAWGHMIHVWVDRKSGHAVPVPEDVRRGLESVSTKRTG
ncbi:MAG: thioesterase family protein [Planctomycetaceae bacterium]|jgi:acyl-CoA thioester hydrolase